MINSVGIVEIFEKRIKPGRRPKSEQKAYYSCCQVMETIQIDQILYEKARERLWCFV